MTWKVCRVLPVITCVLFTAQGSLATSVLEIEYELTPLGGTRWQYTYDVTNASWESSIAEFTIWFDQNTQRNLTIDTPNPPAGDWSELVAQPDLLLHLDGFYDALKHSGGLAAGEHAAGFTVAFDWLGADMPGAQRFEVVDPVSFQTLYSGLTVPEPVSAVLFLAGLAAVARRHHRYLR